MPGWHPRHPNTATLSTVASVAALESVFEHPEVKPMELDPIQLQTATGSIPIPSIDQWDEALSMAKGIAIAIHHAPEGQPERKAFEEGLTDLLIRLSGDHPGAAMYAVDVARIAAHSNGPEAKPFAGRENVIIPVVIMAMADPHFAEVVHEHNKEFLN
jgi:hypothetical protein